MIAEKSFLGKGIGRAASCAMALYGLNELNITRFFCKINEDNVASINLFKSIGFQQCDYAACFKQVELELRKTFEEMKEIFELHGGSYTTIPCPITNGD
jgi:RimJ/RimL family protein N-acetyltransferase